MYQTYQVAIIGKDYSPVTGLLKKFAQFNLPISQVVMVNPDYDELAEQDETLQWQDQALEHVSPDSVYWPEYQLVILAGQDEQHIELAQSAQQAGLWVISLYTSSPEQSVIDPRINNSAIELVTERWVNCAEGVSSQLGLLISTLARELDISAVNVTALLSADAYGKPGVDELAAQAARLLNGLPVESNIFDGQLAFNSRSPVAPLVGVDLEQSLVCQTKDLCQLDELVLQATAVQVPVFFGDSLVVHIQSRYPIYPEEVSGCLSHDDNFKIIDDEVMNPVEHAKDSAQHLVSRIRQQAGDDKSIDLILLADNSKLGKLHSASLIADLLFKQYI